MTRRSRTPPAWKACLLFAAGLVLVGPAHAGWFDSLFGTTPASSSSTSPAAADSRQRTWRIGEFSGVQLVSREAGAADNQQPAKLAAEPLRQQLGLVQLVAPNGSQVALFSPGELGDLIDPLVAAFAAARPGDDVLLLSSSRREGGILVAPTAVTARLFIQGGALQLILHDARVEFYDTYRGTQVAPKFSYGSRTQASAVKVQSVAATNARADWLVLPLNAPLPAAAAAPSPMGPLVAPAAATAMPAASPMPAPPPSVAVSPPPSVAVSPPPVVATPAPAPAPRAKPAGAVPDADEIEQRLQLLKRLRDKNLITEDEYQQKRAEILKLL